MVGLLAVAAGVMSLPVLFGLLGDIRRGDRNLRNIKAKMKLIRKTIYALEKLIEILKGINL